MSTGNNRISIASVRLILAVLMGSWLIEWIYPQGFALYDARWFDVLMRWQAQHRPLALSAQPAIVHVDVNDRTLDQLHDYYLNRDQFARAVLSLASAKVAVQAWDFILPGKQDAKSDAALIEATRSAGNVYWGMAFRLSQPGHKTILPTDIAPLREAPWPVRVIGPDRVTPEGHPHRATFPELAGVSKGLGHLMTQADRDGVYRRLPLLVKWKGGYYPSFSLRVACDYLRVAPENLSLYPGKALVLHGARFPHLGITNAVVPLDRKGNLRINFTGPWERMRHYNFADILQAAEERELREQLREEIAGAIVIVSEASTGRIDMGPVPTDPEYPLSGMHANALNTMLTGRFLREVSGHFIFLIEALMMGALLWLGPRLLPMAFPVVTAIFLLAYLGTTALLFLYAGILLNAAHPGLCVLGGYLALAVHRHQNEAREKTVLRRSFEAYFPPPVVDKIMADPARISRGGQVKEVTVLFSDIKNFTGYSARLTPEQIQQVLNGYFEAMVEVVFAQGGTVDKFIGDGLMVFFGDPEPQPDHALRGVQAALAMQERVRQLDTQGLMPIQIRIGINTCEVVVGNMGSARRLSYTVLGAGVNLAQRLESLSPVGGILISARTYELVKDQIRAEPSGPLMAKGLNEPVNAYRVVMDDLANHVKTNSQSISKAPSNRDV